MFRASLVGLVILGWLLGCMTRGVVVEAQNPRLVFTVDSATGLPTAVLTNGSGALKAIGK